MKAWDKKTKQNKTGSCVNRAHTCLGGTRTCACTHTHTSSFLWKGLGNCLLTCGPFWPIRNSELL